MIFPQNVLDHLIRARDSGNAHPTLRRQRQFTAVLFTKCCAIAGIEVSMGSVGDCYDNAVCETFHASFKKEKIYRHPGRPEPRRVPRSFGYIEGWYHPRRRHSTLGYLSPIEFERNYTELAQLALEAPISPNEIARVDFAARAPISPENGLVVPTGPAQAATGGGQGTNGSGCPLRPVITEQAR